MLALGSVNCHNASYCSCRLCNCAALFALQQPCISLDVHEEHIRKTHAGPLRCRRRVLRPTAHVHATWS